MPALHLKGDTMCACCRPNYAPEALAAKFQLRRAKFGVHQDQDNVGFSDIGKRLNIAANGKNLWKSVANGVDNKKIQAMDRHIIKTGKILDQMKALGEAAKNPKLDAYDRLVLQLQIGRLQHDLTISTNALGSLSAMEANPDVKNAEVAAENYARELCGTYENGNVSKMLMRALERAANNEEWNVAEIAHRIYKPRDLNDPEYGFSKYVFVREDWEVTKDKSVPAVGEILKGIGRSVMDVDAAAVTVEELEKDIEDLKKQRTALVRLIEDVSGESVREEDITETVDDKINGALQRLVHFFDTLYRDFTQITRGSDRDEDGNDIDIDAPWTQPKPYDVEKNVDVEASLASLANKDSDEDSNDEAIYAYLKTAPESL